MNWEELLSSNGYEYVGKCCGGWTKYKKEGKELIRVKGSRIKIIMNGRFHLDQLENLEKYL